MDMPEGTKALVDEAVESAAQTLFTAADVPLARTEELLAAIQGPAVQAVLTMRVEQIVKHGYTAQGDSMLPLGMLAKDARDRLTGASDCLYGDRKNLRVARNRAVAAAALALAFIDRVDFEISLERAVRSSPASEGN